jgi:DNA primase
VKPSITSLIEAAGGDVSRIDPERSGKQAVRCPWHDDRTPSAEIDTLNERFACYACGLSDDAFGILFKVHGLRFPQARDWLQAHGIEVPWVPGQAVQRGSPVQRVRQADEPVRSSWIEVSDDGEQVVVSSEDVWPERYSRGPGRNDPT